MTTLDSGQWVPLREAAAALGISERTARRRIKGAELQGRLVASQKGPAYEVWLDSGQPIPALSSQQGSQTPELLAALAQLERQQTTIMELSGRLGFLQAELQQRDETIRALQAPREEPAPQEPDAVAAVAEKPLGASRPGRWRRLMRWLVAADS